MSNDYLVIGKFLPNIDAPELVTGKALYSIDDSVPGMLYGKILTSPHAHANILSIDTSKAEALPGVRAVLTYEDVSTIKIKEMPVLDSKVRYLGEEVAAVAADTEEIADMALKLIDVDYEVLSVVIDPEEAVKPGAPILHEEKEGGNVVGERVMDDGDIEEGFAASDRIYEGVFSAFSQAVAPLGRLCAIAWWDGDHLTEIDSTQVPYSARSRLATWLDMPLTKIRIITKFMGAGMGEGNVYRYTGIAAYLAKKTNRPVKVITDATYAFAGSAKRRPRIKAYLQAGVKEDGTIMAMSNKVFWDKGVNTCGGPSHSTAASRGWLTGGGHYERPNRHDEGIGTYTNAPPCGAYRGWGRPPTLWCLETFVDRIANDLGINPLDFRLKNCSPMRSVKPLEVAAERFNWKGRWSPPAQKTGTKRRGIGMATVIGWYTGYASRSQATIELLADGRARVLTGISDIGTGSKTALVNVAAEFLGMSRDNIAIYTGDTNLPEGAGSAASRVAMIGGSSVYYAAEDLKSKLFEIIAPELGVEPGDLDVKDDKIFVKASPDNNMTYADAASKVRSSRTGLLLGWGTNPISGPLEDINPLSCQMVEVEVDTETGEVKLLDVINVEDVGQCLNRASVETQMAGGVAVGSGYGQTEDMIYDQVTGAVLNNSYLDYKLPTILDVPTVDLFPYEDEPNPCNPFGARGIGEPVCCPTAPAINNAVYNAIGVNCDVNPVTPQKILELLGKK